MRHRRDKKKRMKENNENKNDDDSEIHTGEYMLEPIVRFIN